MRASYHHYHLLQVIISLVAVNNTSTTSKNYEGMMWDVTEQGVQCVCGNTSIFVKKYSTFMFV